MKKNELDIIMEPHIKNVNIQQIKKPKPEIYSFIMGLILIIMLCHIMCVPNSFSTNQATVLGIIGSTAISIYVLYITIDKENRKNYLEARKNAKILAELLWSINIQLEKIKSGNYQSIVYTKNWIEFYQKCIMYLEYDYLEYLLREFELVEKINKAIETGNQKEIQNLINYRESSISQWTTDFNIITTQINLVCFANSVEEQVPWKKEKRYQKFKKYFITNYSDKVKQLTIEYLNFCNGKCSVEEAISYVIDNIKKQTNLLSGEYKFEAMDQRKLRNAIFNVLQYIRNNDSFSLCWGELTLKEKTNSNNN